MISGERGKEGKGKMEIHMFDTLVCMAMMLFIFMGW
jgi:hypothetical protein